jgi:hypothetical protein
MRMNRDKRRKKERKEGREAISRFIQESLGSPETETNVLVFFFFSFCTQERARF